MRGEKTIAIIGAVHGDEKVGAEVIEKLKKLIDGKSIVGVIANKGALKRGKRFIVQDLNRSFPGDPNGKLEEQIAYRLGKKIKKFDYVLDLHSFSCKSDPFAILTKRTKRHLKLAKASGINKIVFMLPKLASRKALIDHCRCGVSIETGRHNLESTIKRAARYTENILKTFGFLEGKRKRVSNFGYFEVTDVFFKKEKEKIAANVVNFKLVRKGEMVAIGKRRKFMAPYDFYPILAREVAYPDILCLAAKSVKIEGRRKI